MRCDNVEADKIQVKAVKQHTGQLNNNQNTNTMALTFNEYLMKRSRTKIRREIKRCELSLLIISSQLRLIEEEEEETRKGISESLKVIRLLKDKHVLLKVKGDR